MTQSKGNTKSANDMLQYQIDLHAKDIPQGLSGPGLPFKMTVIYNFTSEYVDDDWVKSFWLPLLNVLLC